MNLSTSRGKNTFKGLSLYLKDISTLQSQSPINLLNFLLFILHIANLSHLLTDQ